MLGEQIKLVIGVADQPAPQALLNFNGSVTQAVRELQLRGVARSAARTGLRRLASKEMTGTEFTTKTGLRVPVSVAE